MSWCDEPAQEERMALHKNSEQVHGELTMRVEGRVTVAVTDVSGVR